jgi:ABC-type glycerol-3-phosphate transport system substrate-binding protein
MYNIDMFEAAGVEPPSEGWDWDELLDKARALTNADENQWGVHAWNQWEYGYFPLMYANGARFTDDNFTKTAFNTPESAAALQWFIDLIYVENVAPSPEVSTQLLGPFITDVFASGQVAMAPRSPGSVQAYNEMIGDRFRYKIVEPPVSPTTGQSGAYKGMEPLMMSAEVPSRGHQDAALKFAMFMIGDRYQSHLSKPANRVVTLVNKKVVKGEVGDYLAPPPEGMENVAKIYESDYIYDHPMFAKYGEFRAALWTPVDRAFLNEITAEEALTEAEVACNQVLASV